ncbi:MAG TPA: FAD binding domain-containing protein [Desulfitobacteriaceae bacterium]|nr:FAD binding domain-containing protein [Desulfitobacteriaceae bacterium]
MVTTYRPITLREALEIRSQARTILLAGGSDLMVRQRVWSGTIPQFSNPVVLISHLKELQEISLTENILQIGAGCTLAQIINDPGVPAYLKLPLSQMATPAIRNLGTIGGNICNSSPAGDTLPMLYALDARLTLQSKESARSVDIAEFITGPGHNSLQSDEILSQITVTLPGCSRYFYRKVGARQAMCISKLSFFGLADTLTEENDSLIRDVRIAFGAAAPTVIRSREAENLLKGRRCSRVPQLRGDILACYERLLSPLDDLRSSKEYRRTVALNLLDNFLTNDLQRSCVE